MLDEKVGALRAQQVGPAVLRRRLEAIAGRDRVLDTPAERIAHAHDAGFYRLVPEAVVFPEEEGQIAALFPLRHGLGIRLPFRAAGTSLSGQAISDGVLVDLSRAFGGIEVEEEGA